MSFLYKTAVAAVALAASTAAATTANAATYVYNVTGARSNSDLGGPGNTLANLFLAAGAHITNVAYNVTITANSPSYLSEASLAFTDSAQGDGVFLAPGFDQPNSGTGTFSDSANLVDLGLDFFLLSDGILRLEFFEDFADSVTPDATWTAGTVTFTYDAGAAVPEPATWAMMLVGFAMVGAATRYRRRKTAVSFA